METLIRRLSAADVPYLQEEPLSKHTSFRIGGPAELMAFPRTEAELSVALRAAAEAEIIFGNAQKVARYEVMKLRRLDQRVHAADVIE